MRDCGPITTPSSQLFTSGVATIEKNSSIQSAVNDCGETHICALGWCLHKPAFCFCNRFKRYLGSVCPGSPPGTKTASTRGSLLKIASHSSSALLTVDASL